MPSDVDPGWAKASSLLEKKKSEDVWASSSSVLKAHCEKEKLKPNPGSPWIDSCDQDLQNFTLFSPFKPVSFLTQVTEAQFWCLCKFTLLTKAATEPLHPNDPPEHLQKVGGPALCSTQVLAIPEVTCSLKGQGKVSCSGPDMLKWFSHCQRHQWDVKVGEKVKNAYKTCRKLRQR